MRVVVQRVTSAKVHISDIVHGSIGNGFVILLGIETEDTEEDIDWLVKKIISLRVFGDHNNKMNLDLKDIGGSVLVISQFTLHASTKKGNRPSFIKAAKPVLAIPLYEAFIQKLKSVPIPVETGIFGAEMKIFMINDGPVTIIMDSKNRA